MWAGANIVSSGWPQLWRPNVLLDIGLQQTMDGRVHGADFVREGLGRTDIAAAVSAWPRR